jgi:hypothetical protein
MYRGATSLEKKQGIRKVNKAYSKHNTNYVQIREKSAVSNYAEDALYQQYVCLRQDLSNTQACVRKVLRDL